MSSASDDLPITLIASDGKEVRLSVKAAAYCEIIRNALNLDDDDDDDDHEPPAEGGGRDTVVPLKRVGSEELERIAEFLNYYAEHKMIPIADPLTGGPDSPIEEFLKPTWEENVPQEWYRNFANTLGENLPLLYKVRSTANFLYIHDLTYLVNVWLVFAMMGKSEEEIRQLLCLEKPTQQELDEFYEHHPWVRELEQLELEEQQQQEAQQG